MRTRIDWDWVPAFGEPAGGYPAGYDASDRVQTMNFELWISKTNIVGINTDCVVNAANESLLMGGGVCGAIFNAAGSAMLQAACDKIGHCNTGDAVITPAFNLPNKFVIHAVGPRWKYAGSERAQQLYDAYWKSLELAIENGCHSIGFPLISAGIFGCPVDVAWKIAIKACFDFAEEHIDRFIMITFAILDDTIKKVGTEELQKQFAAKCDDLFSPYNVNERYTFFWHEYENNGCFSNWYERPFIVDGITYYHTGQYVMAQKARLFHDDVSFERIMKTKDPRVCKRIGREVTPFVAEVWEENRYQIVRTGNVAKFEQHPDLRKLLMDTCGTTLVEASPKDSVWGIALSAEDAKRIPEEKWPGQNLLGKVLMDIRADFIGRY